MRLAHANQIYRKKVRVNEGSNMENDARKGWVNCGYSRTKNGQLSNKVGRKRLLRFGSESI